MKKITRNTVLRNSGVALSLPFLESFAAPKAEPLTKLVYLGFIYGVTYKNYWFPEKTGKLTKLTDCLKPLENHKDDLTIFQNITPVHNAHHPHNTLSYLLTCKNFKEPDGGVYDLVSCDQVAARSLGQDTRYESLQLSCYPEGGIGPGHSLSWDQYGKPIPGYVDPVELYHLLFGDDKISISERRYLLKKEKSILDAVHQQSKRLFHKVSKYDQDKVDEYYTSIRHLEKKLEQSEKWLGKPKPKTKLKEPESAISGTKQIEAMYDLIVAALQTDQTRVITYRQPLTPLLKEMRLSNSHPISHHPGNDEKVQESIQKDMAQASLLNYLITKLKNTSDVNGTSLFDNVVLTYSSGVRTAHNNTKLPVIITGRGGGRLKPAGYIELNDDKNRLSNLWLTTLQAAGVNAEKFAYSNGVIEEVMA